MKVTTESAIQPSRNLLATAAIVPIAMLTNRNRHQSAIHLSISLSGLYPHSEASEDQAGVVPVLCRPPLIDQLFGATLLGSDRPDGKLDRHADVEVRLVAVYDLGQHLWP